MSIKCHRCGEELTGPYFHNGKPYGWSCIGFVNPNAKKDKNANRWIIPQMHNLDRSKKIQTIVIIHDGYKYAVTVRFNRSINQYLPLNTNKNVIIDDNNVYVNKNVFHD